MSSSRGTGVSVGGSSILVIFVLLCLTTFATLSLVSANADKKLTDKTALATQEYYAADTKAEEILSVVDKCLDEAKLLASSDEAYFIIAESLISKSSAPIEIDGDLASFSVPVNNNQQLQVVLQLLYPQNAGEASFKRREWKVVNTGDWQPDDEGFNLWTGNDNIILFT